MKCERSWAVSDSKRILSGHPGMKHFWLLSRLLPTSWIYLFWPLRTMLFQALLLRGRLLISDLPCFSRFPFSTGSQLAGSLSRGPAIAPQPFAALCCLQQMALNPPGTAGPRGCDSNSFSALSFSSAKVYNLINLPEIPFHMKSSSIAAVRCTDWSQTAWVLFQRCHLWTVWSWAS